MNIIILFDQEEIWVDRQGVSHNISEMEPRYAANVVRFLERQAAGIVNQYSLAMVNVPMPSEHTMAYDTVMEDFEREMDQMFGNPLSWLQSTPLMVALSERAKVVA